MLTFSFLCGPAGSGKTTLLRSLDALDPDASILCATTGVAAVNLGTTTLNSVLGYFDTRDLTDAFATGRLQRRLRDIVSRTSNLRVDEVSMLDGKQLDVIHMALSEVCEGIGKPFGFMLCGDFCQLPPVKAQWAFEAQCWGEFAANMSKLEKMRRQTDGRFLDALLLARSGKAQEASEALRPLVRWSVSIDSDWDGTTILPKNDAVDNYNKLRYARLQARERAYNTRRAGTQKGEWTKQIPDSLVLKEGAYVMILSNAPRQGSPIDSPTLLYANGDCGVVKQLDTKSVWVELVRNGECVEVGYVERLNENVTPGNASLRRRGRMHVIGTCEYVPLRLAYAATVHKCQGLTLDKVQVDIRNAFFGQPSMAYVALSRAREAGNVRVVGTPELLARRIRLDEKVRGWV